MYVCVKRKTIIQRLIFITQTTDFSSRYTLINDSWTLHILIGDTHEHDHRYSHHLSYILIIIKWQNL